MNCVYLVYFPDGYLLRAYTELELAKEDVEIEEPDGTNWIHANGAWFWNDAVCRLENILTEEQLDAIYSDGKTIRGQLSFYREVLGVSPDVNLVLV